MIQNRNRDITPEDFLKILAQEMMKDGKSNWGRMAVVMALAQKLSIDGENNEELTNSLVQTSLKGDGRILPRTLKKNQKEMNGKGLSSS